jgi:glycosyltransferase involved in cell wall biosynthesis
MKKLLKSVLDYFAHRNPALVRRIAYRMLPDEQLNINIDLANPNQKRVLMCYLPTQSVNLSNVRHASYLHINQMIHYFVSRDYCLDVCTVRERFEFSHFRNRHYDMIIGFGKPFKEMIQCEKIPLKISFIMENNPEVVSEKYGHRLDYFSKRHPGINISQAVPRTNLFDTEQFQLADYAILMSSLYNAKSFRKYFRQLWTINSNMILNETYNFDEEEVGRLIPNTKKNFLWFGSLGLIHKGVDLLVDAMSNLPDCRCDFYGIAPNEKKLFSRISIKNTFDCGRVNVSSKEFIEKIPMQHCFMVFPSCSEGMSTAVATAMSVGIIPILTKECGFDPHPSIILLEDDSVECITEAMKHALAMSNEEILNRRRMAFDYAREAFSLKTFSERFTNIMDEIIEKSNTYGTN